jgi:hypothetical protein
VTEFSEIHVFMLLMAVNLILGFAIWDGGREKKR